MCKSRSASQPRIAAPFEASARFTSSLVFQLFCDEGRREGRGGGEENLVFRRERRAVSESCYICWSSRSMETSWRKAGMWQTEKDEETKKNPSSASVFSLLLFIASFVCHRQKKSKGHFCAGKRRGRSEKGSPLKCTLIVARQKKKGGG